MSITEFANSEVYVSSENLGASPKEVEQKIGVNQMKRLIEIRRVTKELDDLKYYGEEISLILSSWSDKTVRDFGRMIHEVFEAVEGMKKALRDDPKD